MRRAVYAGASFARLDRVSIASMNIAKLGNCPLGRRIKMRNICAMWPVAGSCRQRDASMGASFGFQRTRDVAFARSGWWTFLPIALGAIAIALAQTGRQIWLFGWGVFCGAAGFL